MLKHSYWCLLQTEKMKYNSLPSASLPIYSFTEWCRTGSCFLEWEPWKRSALWNRMGLACKTNAKASRRNAVVCAIISASVVYWI